MRCNIDERGRRVRLIWGAVMLLGSIVAATLALFDVVPSLIGWVAAGALLALGVFGIYEARAGWCVMRAIGIKTPM